MPKDSTAMKTFKQLFVFRVILLSAAQLSGTGVQSSSSQTNTPSISSISPNGTIQSGGILLNIRGINLTSAMSYVLVINCIDFENTINCYERSKCFNETIASGLVTCKTPNILSSTEPYFRRKNSSSQLKAIALLLMDNEHVTKGTPISLAIYRDPIFSNITEDQQLSDRKQYLQICGKHIPTFLKRSDFNVSAGHASCPVFYMSEDFLICNCTDLIEQSKEHLNNSEETRSTSMTSLNQNLFIPFKVAVRIGNYQQDIGVVRVSLAPLPRQKSMFTLLIITTWVFLTVCVLLILMSALVRFKKKRIEENHHEMVQMLDAVFHKDEDDDILDQLNIPYDRVTIGKHIGLGTFGRVYDGILDVGSGFTRKIAVKTLRDPMTNDVDQNRFLKEAVIMKDFKHPNILEIIGLTEENPGIYHVILPLMENGDLLSHIRDFMVTLSVQDVYNFGSGVACGMAYLSSLKFVHRDLAARNCMLDDDHCIKIADFGLCRDVYEKGYYKTDHNVVMPLRWMALESIQTGFYSTKSDVWSFGILLWEMLTRGMTPYPCVDDNDIVKFLEHSRLSAPFYCPDSLYELMMRCWDRDPKRRPDFDAIQRELSKKFHKQTSILALQANQPDSSYVNLSADEPSSGTAKYQNLASPGGGTRRGLEDSKKSASGVAEDVVIKYPSCMSFRHSNAVTARSVYSRLQKERASTNDYTILNAWDAGP